jgi:heat shock protein HslJ
MIKTKMILAIMVITTVFACGTTKSSKDLTAKSPPAEAQLGDGYWELIRLQSVPAIKKPKEDDRKIGFAFQTSENKINGYAGCNSFFGSYDLDGSAISFSQMGSTKMACVRNVIDEQAFLLMFGQVKHIKVEAEIMTLMDAANNVLAVFQKTASDGMAKKLETSE